MSAQTDPLAALRCPECGALACGMDDGVCVCTESHSWMVSGTAETWAPVLLAAVASERQAHERTRGELAEVRAKLSALQPWVGHKCRECGLWMRDSCYSRTYKGTTPGDKDACSEFHVLKLMPGWRLAVDADLDAPPDPEVTT